MKTFAMLLAPPLLGALLAVAVKPYRQVVGWANALLSLLSIGAAVALWGHILAGDVLTSGPAEFLRADALSTLLALCVSVVGALAAWLGPGMGGDDGYDGAQARRFRIFGNLFTFTMLFAVTSNNVGFMWIAIEATTITSAMLIPLHVTKASVEASWKYILIGSVGIALAFGGTVLGYFDFVNLAGHREGALNWTVLMASASRLHPQVIQLAFVFILIGYGTKAGLAPMHTWLPDAHSEAPAPLSAMMSGVLLAVALYAVIRWEAVVNAAVGTRFTDGLFIALGVLSLVIAAFSLVVQQNYKRMLAYSSIEHTGLMCVGLALGPLGTFAAMLHLVNHTLAKSMMFFLAGRVLHRYRTTEIGRVSGLLTVMPWTGGLFAAGVLAVVGLPPFGLFISEFALFRAGFAAGRPWLMGLVLALLAVAFVSMIGHLNRMLYGAPAPGVTVGEGNGWPLVPLGLCVVALVGLGLTLPAPLQVLLERIVEIAGR
ncbi:MAG: hydrogenase 4 subunit F [Candidatus Rokubacteria bacterium]|nr:hydrogenase 4 subunit F [Candidatus Rokubacteria bacterium]MBI3108978.1 hydrogenase 4 subunit F [Candidatus Rokubacteria bacterium]